MELARVFSKHFPRGLETSVIFVARTLGRFDVLITVRAFSAAQLVEILDAVRAMPGVNGIDSWAHLEVVKESYASGLGDPAM